ncbi:MAG: hypothetical protein ACYS8W_13845 [Planctomycetota bacterium]
MKSIYHFRWIFILILLIGLFLLPGIAVSGDGDDDDDDDDSGFNGVEVDPDKVEAAIKKGVEWVKGKQAADGSWASDGAGHTNVFTMGYTALCTFALLKGEVGPNDPVIVKAFTYLKDAELKHTYSVACYVLALEARYAPPPPKPAKKGEKKKKDPYATVPYEEQMKRNWHGKATPHDRKKMQELIDWLVSKQTDTVWRYPKGTGVMPAGDSCEVDNSNTQYVLLALNAGRRCGCKIAPDVWIKTAKYFVEEQEKDGPEVKPFIVPAADLPIAKLKKIQKEFLKKLHTARKKAQAKKTFAGKKEREEMEEEEEKKGPRTSVIDPEELKFGVESHEMKARGWSYTPKGKGGKARSETATGSMTTSGVAALVICKAALEPLRVWKGMRKDTNQAIRDGAAWLAHNFSDSSNPNSTQHYYYYLYGLERAGVLSCCEMFGEHDWYGKGANAILARQNADGSWPNNDRFSGATANTCFCILFLKRATTPLVGNPNERVVWTGAGLNKGKKK